MKIRSVGIIAAVLIGCAAALILAVNRAKEASIDARAQCPLNQVQLGLSNYHATYGHFPPAYLADKDGKPMHSWRVLILPFMECQELYDAYSFDEPWNGPNNSKLMDKMPREFHVCSEPASRSMTNIVAIVGPGTAFPGAKTTSLADFRDGADNTLLLAETAHSDIPWLEPRDLHVEEMSFHVNDRTAPSISCSRRKGPFVVFADSIHAYRLSSSLSPETLRALTTIAGEEKLCMADIADVGLATLTAEPVTNESVRQLSLAGVRSLWLNRSDVTDDSLEYLASVPELVTLHLRGTRITDDGLRHFSRGATIARLDLSDTGIGNEGLRHLEGLAREHGLGVDLNGTRVTMQGVAQLLKAVPQPKYPSRIGIHIKDGSVTHEFMFLSGSDVDDADIEAFRGLSSFRQVWLEKTKITDRALDCIETFENLVQLNVRHTAVTDARVKRMQPRRNCTIER